MMNVMSLSLEIIINHTDSWMHLAIKKKLQSAKTFFYLNLRLIGIEFTGLHELCRIDSASQICYRSENKVF